MRVSKFVQSKKVTYFVIAVPALYPHGVDYFQCANALGITPTQAASVLNRLAEIGHLEKVLNPDPPACLRAKYRFRIPQRKEERAGLSGQTTDVLEAFRAGNPTVMMVLLKTLSEPVKEDAIFAKCHLPSTGLTRRSLSLLVNCGLIKCSDGLLSLEPNVAKRLKTVGTILGLPLRLEASPEQVKSHAQHEPEGPFPACAVKDASKA